MIRIGMRQAKHDIDTIRFMLTLSRRNGFYCQSCSPKRKPVACGRTCALLRPDSYKNDMATVLASLESHGRNNFSAQMRKHKTIAADLKRCGDNISLYEVKEWEALVDGWVLRGWNASERWGNDEPLSINVDFGMVDWNGRKSRDRSHLKRKLDLISC